MRNSGSPRERVAEGFASHYGAPPAAVIRAPGRVNLIGDHTDYQDGFVLPMAIDRAVWIALRSRADRLVHVRSLDFDETVAFALADLRKGGSPWTEYLKGVAWALQEAGHSLRGWEGVITGDLPIGAGLASSAAVEMAAARAFAVTSKVPWDPPMMAKVGQRAENRWVGVRCGIMDQMISAAGVAGHALLIDCRSLTIRPVPLPPGAAVVVMDTATRRGLVDSAYNERRHECATAAQVLGVTALRDVGAGRVRARLADLDESMRRRARHVVTENERTVQAAEAMSQGDVVEVGRLMRTSHASLRDDFQVSSAELDAIVACADREEACYGARMTGAGFGGCAVALVRSDAADRFAASIATCYQAATGRTPTVHICAATNGVEVVGEMCG